MRYFPVVAMFVSASAFTIYLLTLDYEFQNWELDTMLIMLSPVFLAGFLVWIMKYPDSFDVRGLYDEFDIASRLTLVDAPDSVRREQMKELVEKLFPRLADDLKKAMIADLEEWPEQPPEPTAGRTLFGEPAQNDQTPDGAGDKEAA